MPSIFTKIINGEIPCYKIYEDEMTFAFLDIHPETPGHLLVVPKVEVDRVYDLDDTNYTTLWASVKKLAQRMEKVLNARILIKVIGTDVPHAHVHLIPLDTEWHSGRILAPSEAEFQEMALKLKL